MHGEDIKEEPHSHIHGIVKGNPILALVVFIALSFHSVMEGMGMGASSSPAWDILVAILAHKSLAAFALALEFLHHNVSRKQLLSSVAVFSLMTPTGILFGRLLVDTNHATPAGGVCAAFAGGTFLFVAIMEIIRRSCRTRGISWRSALLCLPATAPWVCSRSGPKHAHTH